MVSELSIQLRDIRVTDHGVRTPTDLKGIYKVIRDHNVGTERVTTSYSSYEMLVRLLDLFLLWWRRCV